MRGEISTNFTPYEEAEGIEGLGAFWDDLGSGLVDIGKTYFETKQTQEQQQLIQQQMQAMQQYQAAQQAQQSGMLLGIPTTYWLIGAGLIAAVIVYKQYKG